MSICRRGFLLLGSAGLAAAQAPPPAPPPLPEKAKITSSVMLWTLAGTFEERVKTAALAGIQRVELVDEYVKWDHVALRKAKRYIESFGMTAETVIATPNWAARPVSMVNPAEREGFLADVRTAIAVAKQMEAPYVILMSGKEIAGQPRADQYASLLEGAKQAGALAAAADVILIVEPLNNKVDHKGCFLTTCAEGAKVVREADNPHVRLLFDVYHEEVQQGNVLAALTEAMEWIEVVHIADAPGRNDPGTGAIRFGDVYRALAKAGYNHSVAMEYRPKGNPVVSLKKAVDAFRAGVNERGGSAASTEGSLV